MSLRRARRVCRVRSVGSVLGVAMLLAGCVTAPVVAPQAPGRTPDPELLSQWIAKGRIALLAQGEGGSGSFVWQQRSERTELDFRGPFGAGGLHIITDGERLEVTDAEGQAQDGQSARQVLEQRLGVDLPLAVMRYWIIGLPAPGDAAGAPDTMPAADRTAQGFTQAGWNVSYDEFRPVAGWSLPARLNAVTEGVRVRIVVDDWQLPTP